MLVGVMLCSKNEIKYFPFLIVSLSCSKVPISLKEFVVTQPGPIGYHAKKEI
jgi:hypothetical protein